MSWHWMMCARRGVKRRGGLCGLQVWLFAFGSRGEIFLVMRSQKVGRTGSAQVWLEEELQWKVRKQQFGDDPWLCCPFRIMQMLMRRVTSEELKCFHGNWSLLCALHGIHTKGNIRDNWGKIRHFMSVTSHEKQESWQEFAVQYNAHPAEGRQVLQGTRITNKTLKIAFEAVWIVLVKMCLCTFTTFSDCRKKVTGQLLSLSKNLIFKISATLGQTGSTMCRPAHHYINDFNKKQQSTSN